MVGTGGPHQTVHHSSHHRGHHSSSGSDYYDEHLDNISPGDRQKYGDRGDIPGYMIPGYNQYGNIDSLLIEQLLQFFSFKNFC